MKIKTVCDITGLTDRTIRYYIEEGLISPAYTENYLGRKSFDFTEADVQQLKDISVLRKFGFSITEIKEIHGDPKKIFYIVKDLQQRKQDIIDEENESYDIYAQWPLEKAEFYEEIARVRTLYEKREYVTVKHGDYICYFSSVGGGSPFQEATTGYYPYYIFAYDEQNLTVRYIMSYSLGGAAHQPYYMSLDW